MWRGRFHLGGKEGGPTPGGDPSEVICQVGGTAHEAVSKRSQAGGMGGIKEWAGGGGHRGSSLQLGEGAMFDLGGGAGGGGGRGEGRMGLH